MPGPSSFTTSGMDMPHLFLFDDIEGTQSSQIHSYTYLKPWILSIHQLPDGQISHQAIIQLQVLEHSVQRNLDSPIYITPPPGEKEKLQLNRQGNMFRTLAYRLNQNIIAPALCEQQRGIMQELFPLRRVSKIVASNFPIFDNLIALIDAGRKL